MTDPTIATDVNTGALVVTAAGGRGGLRRLRHGVTGAIRQRPVAVVVDLSRLSPAAALPALVCLARPRRGVSLLTRVPTGLRALRRLPGVTAAPLPEVLGHPGLARALERVCARFGPDVDAPGAARALVAEAVSTWQVDHLNLPAQLIASELVSNAVEHAGTGVEFRLLRMRYGLCIAVRDDDPSPPMISARDEPRAGRGWGLRIVARTAHRWGWLLGTADKIVWAALRDTLPRAGRVAGKVAGRTVPGPATLLAQYRL